MDTTKIEYTAEDLISHKLQRSGILVAKPKFDREGTDLLAFKEMADEVKFCRIQCKGRTLSTTSKYTEIKIPMSYLSPGFIVFLYIENDDKLENCLYCFFHADIEQWKKRGKSYVLRIKRKSYIQDLEFYIFNAFKIGLIEGIIKSAETSGEYRRLIYGDFNVTEGSTDFIHAIGTVKNT